MPMRRVAPARRVKRLRVRAEADETARRAAVMLTDALSTASLPGADSAQLVVIRRLALGRIPATASSASLALHIERATRDIASHAVTFNGAAAATADAVAFPDRAEALVALARLTAAASPSDDWFWPLVVPGWSARAPLKERWSRLLAAAHDGPDAAIVAAAVLDVTIRARAEADLLSSMAPGDGARWLRLAGWTDISRRRGGASPPLRTRHDEIVRLWSCAWSAVDDRLLWLATMARVIERPASAGDPELPARVGAALMRADAATAADARSGESQPTPTTSSDAAARTTSTSRVGAPQLDASSVDDTASMAANHAAEELPRAPRATIAGAHESADAYAAATAVEHDCASSAVVTVPAEGLFTFFAGLLFVVPILDRLRFGMFLDAQPALRDGGFAMHLLRFIGRRAGLRPDDPLAIALDEWLGDHEPDGFAERPGVAALPIVARELLETPPPRTPLGSHDALWLTAVRRWCRRRARMGLTTVVRRPGRVHMTRTHVDVSFALSQLDVRARRVALDVNPGWVPWLGRAVQFTYGASIDRDG